MMQINGIFKKIFFVAILLLSIFAAFALFNMVSIYDKNIHSSYENHGRHSCIYDRPYEAFLSDYLDVSDVSDVEHGEFMLQFYDFSDKGYDRDYALSVFDGAVSDHVDIVNSSDYFIYIAVTEKLGGHYFSERYGAAIRLISLGVCSKDDRQSPECYSLSYALYGPNRHLGCDIEQSVNELFSNSFE